MKKNKGILLINLGTPDSPSEYDVRRYLDQFLMDPYVVDLPWFARVILVKGIILNTRPKASAKAYQKIWTDQGSPLLTHSRDLINKLNATNNENIFFEIGMRYGNPNIKHALQSLTAKNIEELFVIPLFPQYSLAATESAIQEFYKSYKEIKCSIPYNIIRDFYAEESFIQAQTSLIETKITSQTDAILLSYHGLPIKHLSKAGCNNSSNCANQNTACPSINSKNRNCYRAQCYATSNAIADKLDFDKNKIFTSFQSRLGKTPWIKPYTDEILPILYQQGARNLVIACPSFVADCLETIEEIGIQAQKQWQTLGGKSFALAPCLNSHNDWVKVINNFIR